MIAVLTLIYVEKLLASLQDQIKMLTSQNMPYYFTSFNAHR